MNAFRNRLAELGIIDTDVHNMARWGILFQDCDQWFHGSYSKSDPSPKSNVWNYIDEFGHAVPAGTWEEHWNSDTPLFWAVWNEITLDPEDPYLPIQTKPYSPLLDWEYELLASQPIWDRLNQKHNHIGTEVLRRAL